MDVDDVTECASGLGRAAGARGEGRGEVGGRASRLSVSRLDETIASCVADATGANITQSISRNRLIMERPTVEPRRAPPNVLTLLCPSHVLAFEFSEGPDILRDFEGTPEVRGARRCGCGLQSAAASRYQELVVPLPSPCG